MGKNIIVIGAGVGGLSVGAFLAGRDYSVTIFEKNNIYGGYCQGFKRKGFLINPSVLRVGTEECANRIDGYCEQLGMEKQEWVRYADTYLFGKEHRIELGTETLEQGLIKCFPEEKSNIQKFFYDTERIFNIANKVMKNDMNFGILSIEEMKEYLPYIKLSTQEIIEKYFANSVEIQNVLLAVMDLDSKSAAITMLINIYAVKNNGKAHIMKGGMWTFIRSLVNYIEEKGGKVLCNKTVERIIVEDNVAKGVFVNNEEFYADAVISAMDIKQTYFNLMDSNIIKNQKSLKKMNDEWLTSHSCFSVWLGLHKTKEELNIKEESMIIYPEPKDTRTVREIMNAEDESLPNNFWYQLFTAFSSDSVSTPMGKGQIAIGVIVPYSMESYWGKYNDKKEVKQRIQEMVIKKVEELFPQIIGNYVVLDTATPLTYERYTGNYMGAYYGFKKTRSFVCDKSRPTGKGWIDNLYLCSQWTSSTGGCMGIMQEAIRTANLIMKELPNDEKELKEYDLMI